MKAIKFSKTLEKDGILTIENIPAKKGDTVEIIVLLEEKDKETTATEAQIEKNFTQKEKGENPKSFFQDKIFVVTGTFSGVKRDDLKQKIESLGGVVKNSITKQTNYLIAGEKSGSKLKKAKDSGIEVLDEAKILEILSFRSEDNKNNSEDTSLDTIFSREKVYIGKLNDFSKKDITKKVKDMGGILEEKLTQNTRYLICDKTDDYQFDEIIVTSTDLKKIFELEALRKDIWPTPLLQKKQKPTTELPESIAQPLNKKGLTIKDLPVKLISFLGSHGTSLYSRCPNIPEHYEEIIPVNYYEDLEDMEQLFRFDDLFEKGRFYWFDFEITGVSSKKMLFRLCINEGDSDCNDGLWGAVWDLETKELVMNIASTGDCETTLSAISQKYIDVCESYDKWFPDCKTSDDELEQGCYYDFLQYEKDTCFERLVGLAVKMAMGNRA